MKRLLGIYTFAIVGIVTSLSACALFTRKNANTALDAVQLACIFNSAVTQEETLAKICDVSLDMLPVIRKLVSQREAAARAGVKWKPATDGGKDGEK